MAAKAILEPKSARPVIQGIESRKGWLEIKERYRVLMEAKTSGEVIYQLTEEYHYSEKNIQAIIYERYNPCKPQRFLS
jgi:hypothetical protein